MKAIRLILAALLIAGTAVAGSSGNALKKKYKVAKTRIDATKQTTEQNSLTSYGKTLDAYLAHFKKQGDLDSYTAVNAEKVRFEASKVVLTSDKAQNAYVQKVALQYEQGMATAKKTAEQLHLRLLKRYKPALEGLVKSYMQADKMAEAKAVKEELDRVGFIIADLEASQPQKPAVPDDAKEYRGHHYKVFKGHTSWHEAKKKCEEMGGHLACVTSSLENKFVSRLAGGAIVWLGAADEKAEGKWQWVTGEAFRYSHWYKGQPSTAKGKQDNYLHLGVIVSKLVPDEWNDAPNDFHPVVGYICEWDY